MQIFTLLKCRVGSLDDGREWAKVTMFGEDKQSKANVWGVESADYSVDMDIVPKLKDLTKDKLPARFKVVTSVKVKSGVPTLQVTDIQAA